MSHRKPSLRTNGYVFILGLLSSLLGMAVIIGWLTQQTTLIQMFPHFAPMQFNSAMGFVLGGLGLMSLYFSRPLAAVLGVILFILGFSTLLEYVFNSSFGIDELFIKHSITVDTSHPGRMGPNTAFNFVLSGISLFLASGIINRKAAAYAVSIFSLLILLIAALTLAGYITGVPLSYGWGSYTSMPIHAAVGFLFLGAGFFLFDIKFLEKNIPWFVLFIAPLLILVITGGFLAAEAQKIYLTLDLNKESLISRFSDYFVYKGQALERLQAKLEANSDRIEEAWKKDIDLYFKDFPALESIAWVDRDGSVKFIHTNGLSDHEPDFKIGDLSELNQSQEKFLPYFTIVTSESGKNHFEMIIPFQNPVEGYFIAFIQLDKLIEFATYKYFLNKFHLIVSSSQNKPLYLSSQNFKSQDDPVSYARWKLSDSMEINNIRLLFTLWPKASWLNTLQGLGPFLLAALLICLTVIGIILTYFISSKLRLERLQALVLNSSGEGIFGLDLEGKTVFVNPAAVNLLGWKEEELIGKPQHPLIHHSKRDGSPYPLEACSIHASLKEGKYIKMDDEIFWRKDGSFFDVELISRPIIEKKQVKGAVVTFNDITERKKLENELLKRREELAASNKELENFSHSVSHDLRAPLKQIIGFIQLIEEDASIKASEESKKYFNYIVSSAEQMERLIDDLLAYSRLTRISIKKRAVSLAALVDNIQQQLKEEYPNRSIQWDISPLPTVVTDRTLVYTVLLNLISNALKFTQHEPVGIIEIGCEETEEEWIFSVRDNGVGFDPKHREKLFQMFQRLHSESEFGGSGIGLANVARAIARLGGRVWAESGTNKGASFYFTLPKEN